LQKVTPGLIEVRLRVIWQIKRGRNVEGISQEPRAQDQQLTVKCTRLLKTAAIGGTDATSRKEKLDTFPCRRNINVL
jgi:hypothetical protein